MKNKPKAPIVGVPCMSTASGGALKCALAARDSLGRDHAVHATSKDDHAAQRTTWQITPDGRIKLIEYVRGKRKSERFEEARATPLRDQKLADVGYCGAPFQGFARASVCTLTAGHDGLHENTSVGIREIEVDERPLPSDLPEKPTEDELSLTDVCPKCGRELGEHDGKKCPKPEPATKPKMVSKIYTASEREALAKREVPPSVAHRCGECAEEFPAPVWHCMKCAHHWPMTHSECGNCRSTEIVAIEPQQTGLLSVEKARQFLEQSRSVDEVRDVADKAKAVALYLRSRGAALESQNDAAEIRLRAERRLGELTKEMPKATGSSGPGRGKAGHKSGPAFSATPTYADQGIDKRDAAKWQQLAAIPAKRFEQFVENTRDKGERITSSAPLKLAKLDDKAKFAAELRAKPVPQATGRFDVIVSDPPWAYEKRAGDVTHRTDLPYPSMQINEICALRIEDRCEEDCILWLWTTNAFMRDAYNVLDAWGFQEKTILTWVKDRMGTGDWLRGQTEHCILAVRGRPIVQLTNETTVIHGLVREHSRKPDEFYALVEKLCPGTKLEMFARQPRPGWAAWGAESTKFTSAA